MPGLSNIEPMFDVGSNTTLFLPPNHPGYNPDLVGKDLERVKATDRIEKASVSAKEYDSDTDTVFGPPRPLPARFRVSSSSLTRGLQVPTRFHSLYSGFPFPEVLRRSGVTHEEWIQFTHEVKRHASLSASQWMVTVAGGASLVIIGSPFMGLFSFLPAAAFGHRLRTHKERLNFLLADQTGALAQCVARWNKTCFKAKGLAVRVDVPGNGQDMEDMDLSTSKLFKMQQKTGAHSRVAGSMSNPHDRHSKERRLQRSEGHARVKAIQKGRIVIIPLDYKGKPLHKPSGLRKTAFPGLN